MELGTVMDHVHTFTTTVATLGLGDPTTWTPWVAPAPPRSRSWGTPDETRRQQDTFKQRTRIRGSPARHLRHRRRPDAGPACSEAAHSVAPGSPHVHSRASWLRRATHATPRVGQKYSLMTTLVRRPRPARPTTHLEHKTCLPAWTWAALEVLPSRRFAHRRTAGANFPAFLAGPCTKTKQNGEIVPSCGGTVRPTRTKSLPMSPTLRSPQRHRPACTGSTAEIRYCAGPGPCR